MRWDVLRNHAQMPGGELPPDPAVIQEAVKLSAETGAMLGEDPLLRQAFWCDVDRMLRSAKPADLLPLRALQDSKAENLADEVRKQGDASEAVWFFRCYPWAHSAQEVLIDFGETALRNGRRHWAERAFQDVLAHADDPELIAQAHIGCWFALAGQPERREELERAMSAVPDDTLLPWRGGQAKATEIKAAIRIPMPVTDATPVPALSSVRRLKIELPAAMAAVEPVRPGLRSATLGLGPWTLRRIESGGNLVVVIGSRHVACYDASTQKLLRLCGEPVPPDNAVEIERPAVLGRSWSSVVGQHAGLSTGGEAIYRLMPIKRGDRLEYSVTARDAGSGRILWSTGGRDEWKELWPQSEPIAGEGCLYVLAAGGRAGKVPALYLVCLDSLSGSIAWKRMLGPLPGNDRLRELALGGSAITVQRGAVYVSTDIGMLARCDVRDGALEWVRAYPSEQMDEHSRIQYQRDGTAPLVLDGKLFVAPRDHTGVMALDAATGRSLWEKAPVPSDRIVGVAGQVLVTQGGDGLAAFDLASGAGLWTQALDGARAPRALVAGAHVLVTQGDRLLRFLAATGAAVDELRLNGTEGSQFALLADGALAEFVEERAADPVEQAGSVAGPLRLPLAVQWELPCERPMLVTGPAGAETNTVGVLSGSLLLCVEAQPRGRVVWQSRQRSRPNSVGFHGNLFLAARDRTLTALNAASGVTEWVLNLPFRADIIGGDERLLFVGQANVTGSVAAIEPRTGKVSWQQEFGKEARLAGGRLEWISLQGDGDAAGAPSLHLYWSSAAFDGDGNRPAEVVVDAASGGVREVKRFLPGEPQWPRQIAFGDVRTYGRLRRLPPWPARGPFLTDALAYVGDGGRAHFARLAQPGQDLVTGLNLVMNVQPEGQYWSSVGLHPTADGSFVARMGKLMAFDALSPTGTVYELPRTVAARAAYNIVDFQANTGTVMVVSGPESALPESIIERQKRDLASGGLTNASPDQTAMSVDVFNRATGQLTGTQELPGATAPGAGYANQARLLGGGLLTTDDRGVYFLRSGLPAAGP